jgi:exopolyphosphatase/guanosine-5'-triphosphate,3'-diphosphate pyrophosphatase
MSEAIGANTQYAGIDLGSNSFHMVLAHASSIGGLRMIDRHKEYVRMAAGLDSDNYLSSESIQRGLQCLKRFAERLQDVPVDHIRCVGTNTLRQARNASDFLEEGEAILGRRIDIVSGLEEARLVYQGVMLEAPQAGRRLVIDIGGGSTEIILGTEKGPERLDSMHVGCVSTTSRFFQEGLVLDASMRAAILNSKRQLQHLYPDLRGQFEFALGSSGTINCIGRIVTDLFGTQGKVTRQSLHQLEQLVIESGRIGAFKHPEVSQDRSLVLAGGIAVLQGVMSAFKLEEITPVSTALREGLLVELIGRERYGDRREETIRSLQQQFDVDTTQAERVERTALYFFEQVKDWVQVERQDARDLLRWSARLHEVGIFMGFSGYQKHSAYLVANSDLPGFSVDKQRTIAALVLFHRGQISHRRLERFKLGGCFHPRLVALLRLAVRLNRRRSERPLPDINVQANDRHLTLDFPEQWLAEHPLAELDLASEQRRCAEAGLTITFR